MFVALNIFDLEIVHSKIYFGLFTVCIHIYQIWKCGVSVNGYSINEKDLKHLLSLFVIDKPEQTVYLYTRAQLFKANDVVSLRFVKIYIKWYANMLNFLLKKCE